MNPATKQDVQTIIDNSRSRIFERAATKQDLVVLHDAIRNVSNLQQQSYQFIKQAEQQRLQYVRRTDAVEARLSTIENEIRATQNMIGRVLDRMAAQRIQQVTLPNQPEQQPDTRYVYRPA